jgi:hypothetical protein
LGCLIDLNLPTLLVSDLEQLGERVDTFRCGLCISPQATQ